MGILIVQLLPFILFTQGNYFFGPSIRVNDDSAGTYFHATTQRCIACRADTVYLVWRDDRFQFGADNNGKIFFSKSTDAGNMWSANSMIGPVWDSVDFFLPHLALDAIGNIHVACCSKSDNNNDRDIYFIKSTDGGNSFMLPVMVNDSAVVQWQTFCAIAVDSSGQNVYVVWEDSRNNHDEDIYLAHSTDGGLTFLPSVCVNTADSMDDWFPVVACNNSGQCVYVAWSDQRDTMDILNGWDVYFTHSTDYGQTFAVNFPINDTSVTANTPQYIPSIYYKSGILYAVWKDGRDGYSVYFAKSTDGGISFGNNIRVPDNSDARGNYPSMSANDSGHIFIVWSDRRNSGSYEDEIYFAFSSDSGETFSPNICVNDHLGNIMAWDFVPCICANDSGKVFVAWHSDRNDPSHSNFDIYTSTGTYVGILEDITTQPAASILCTPNPFSQNIRFKIQDAGFGAGVFTLRIYDAAGRLINQHEQLTAASISSFVWDGKDMNEQVVPAGVYLVQVKTNTWQRIEKIIKIGGGK